MDGVFYEKMREEDRDLYAGRLPYLGDYGRCG